MLISTLVLIAIAASGAALTYLITSEKPLMWRLAAGNVIGSAIFGTAAFVVASIFGLSVVTVLVALAIAVSPLLLLKKDSLRGQFFHEWAKAKGKLQGANLKKFRAFAYYAFFFLLFWLFFERAMFELRDGIYTGGSNNLGDLPYHLGAIFSFTEGNNFPPQNPSWAGVKFTYPFIADLLTACFIKLGASVSTAMFVQNLSWAFSLLVILEGFTARLTRSRLAGRIAPALLFFSGGLGFIWLLKDAGESGKGLVEFLWNLQHDYTIGDHFRWGNSMITLFMTQRSILLGMPLTVLVLGYLWTIFTGESEKADTASESTPRSALSYSSLIIGFLAGLLPLIHMHSLMVLFVVTMFLFIFNASRWREWISFGAGVSIVAVPLLIWSLAGSATETKKFFEFFLGWDARDTNVVWFWIKNTGLVFPLLFAGLAIIFIQYRRAADASSDAAAVPHPWCLLLFYIPFFALFVISNTAKLAPWEWDNIKVLIYWFVGSLPFIAYALVWAWQKSMGFRIVAGTCFMVLALSGAIDVWRTISGQIRMRIFDSDSIAVANQIKQRTEKTAIFLNAPTYNSATVLSGRLSLMRYNGHLLSHGIDYGAREQDVKRIYEGGGVADVLLRKHNIDYVLVSPEERNVLRANEEFFKKYPVIAESGQYRVYKVK